MTHLADQIRADYRDAEDLEERVQANHAALVEIAATLDTFFNRLKRKPLPMDEQDPLKDAVRAVETRRS